MCTCDPYTAPAVVFQLLKVARSLPELDLSDINVDNLSPHIAARMKAYKSTDSSMYLRSGWVHDAAIWEVKSRKY